MCTIFTSNTATQGLCQACVHILRGLTPSCCCCQLRLPCFEAAGATSKTNPESSERQHSSSHGENACRRTHSCEHTAKSKQQASCAGVAGVSPLSIKPMQCDVNSTSLRNAASFLPTHPATTASTAPHSYNKHYPPVGGPSPVPSSL